ncbi:MAG: glutathione S-transferase N-terminal domain-containing protein [Rhodospirillaceae bacterium]|nr:glutathione S-transferase N-terminal domain-containing protein [Rhodospirillaceae bacterium]
MIDLYTFPTPNGWKASIMLEELGLPYNTHIVHIGKDEQFKPEFLKISPNNKIPAIVDSDGPDGKPISVFESAAILVYLAQKTKSNLLPSDPRRFTNVMQWVFFQMASVGPMFGQYGHFARMAKVNVPYAIERYETESKRIIGVMETQLAANAYLAGPDYTIADIACHGWMVSAARNFDGLNAWPHVKAWHEKVGARPAVQRGLKVPVLPT